MAEGTCAADDLTFGAALDELEQIVRSLESGQLELEDSLAQYERGVALLTACQKKLGAAQQRVTVLLGEIEGEQTQDAACDSGEIPE